MDASMYCQRTTSVILSRMRLRKSK
ncbi:hypothetical protein TorRG33x02_230900 [Trema orientale]|uniref:Uncharacterized protein n=1 Tax=Trema orientale TaxID=63057 RepID=A0A2P5E6G9_TREOI|nr:hypothetical protein TorRG33x02_230900 [Trema orientale]